MRNSRRLRHAADRIDEAIAALEGAKEMRMRMPAVVCVQPLYDIYFVLFFCFLSRSAFCDVLCSVLCSLLLFNVIPVP